MCGFPVDSAAIRKKPTPQRSRLSQMVFPPMEWGALSFLPVKPTHQSLVLKLLRVVSLSPVWCGWMLIECLGFCLVMGGNEGETEGLRVWGQLNSNLLEIGQQQRGVRRSWMSHGFNKGRAGTDQASVQCLPPLPR